MIQGIDIGIAEVLSETGKLIQGTGETRREITVQAVVTTTHHGAEGDVMKTNPIISTPDTRETSAQGAFFICDSMTPALSRRCMTLQWPEQ